MRELHLSAPQLVDALLEFDAARRVAILDSCGRAGGDSRYLIAGVDAAESGEVFCRSAAEANDALRTLTEKIKQKPFDKSLLAETPLAEFLPLCVVTFAYEMGLLFENIATQHINDTKEPTMTYAVYKTVFVHDYVAGKTFIAGENIETVIEDARRVSDVERSINSVQAQPAIAKSNFTQTEYCQAVKGIRRHIAVGNIYQANLTQQLNCKLHVADSVENVFRRLRETNPAPFAAFIRRAEDVVISASPERFLEVQSPKSNAQSPGIIVTSPIKGTRRRGQNSVEDEQLRRELETSRKDRAENVMIVDLLRNDLGRVCEFGTVQVTELCRIETHPTLFHLVSTIKGRLRADVSLYDILKATFPCGSITGAPKIRAMRIIDETEKSARGLSMGAIGCLGASGSLNLSVAIRTATVRGDTAIFNVGGGIVAGSDPLAEYEESLLKAKALLRAFNATLPIDFK